MSLVISQIQCLHRTRIHSKRDKMCALSAASESCSQHTDNLKGWWVALCPTLTPAPSAFHMCFFVIVFFRFKTCGIFGEKHPGVVQTEGKRRHYLIFAPARNAIHRLFYFLSVLFSGTLAVCLVVVSKPKLGFWFRDVVFLLLTFPLLSSLLCWCPPPVHTHLSSSSFIHQEIVSCPLHVLASK